MLIYNWSKIFRIRYFTTSGLDKKKENIKWENNSDLSWLNVYPQKNKQICKFEYIIDVLYLRSCWTYNLASSESQKTEKCFSYTSTVDLLSQK